MTTKPNLYLSFDIETDGCVPILNNMISIGFYGLDDNMNKHFEYSANIETLEGHSPEEKCMTNFWNLPENQMAWNELQNNKRNYVEVMTDLSEKFKELSTNHKLIFVAHPASFDFSFFKCYYELAKSKLSKDAPPMYDIGFSCECASTLWKNYVRNKKLSSSEATKLYKTISEVDESKKHIAVYDAMFQGIAYIKIKNMYANI